MTATKSPKAILESEPEQYPRRLSLVKHTLAGSLCRFRQSWISNVAMLSRHPKRFELKEINSISETIRRYCGFLFLKHDASIASDLRDQ